MESSFISSEFFALIVIPLLIFFARICDVTLGTIRVIFISKGIKYIAPLIGFFEVIIWLLAMGQIMNNLTNVTAYIAYGAGFAAGTFIGMIIEEKISLGLVSVRLIVPGKPDELAECLRSHMYGVTLVDGEGAKGKVTMVYTIIKRQDLPFVSGIIQKFHPGAFYSVEEIKTVAEGIFPEQKRWGESGWREAFRLLGKGR
jgi:uncharacterized protein YebE (UPF0316 family)